MRLNTDMNLKELFVRNQNEIYWNFWYFWIQESQNIFFWIKRLKWNLQHEHQYIPADSLFRISISRNVQISIFCEGNKLNTVISATQNPQISVSSNCSFYSYLETAETDRWLSAKGTKKPQRSCINNLAALLKPILHF